MLKLSRMSDVSLASVEKENLTSSSMDMVSLLWQVEASTAG